MNEETVTGTFKYSPPISAEKIIETTTHSFSQLCRTPRGKDVAVEIINNYLNNEQPRNSKQLSGGREILKSGVGKKLPAIREDVDES